MDPGMNSLLKWAVENSDTAQGDGSARKELSPAENRFDAAALNALMGGPSDADLMKESMAAILSPDIVIEQKMIAFDNLEQLVESIDNANNLTPLGLWDPLIKLLSNDEPQIRKMAAWCIGTAVQNNPKSQAKLSELNAVPIIARLAVSDPEMDVRQKMVYALSSEIRNYPPALEQALEVLPADITGPPPVDSEKANDMDYVDSMMSKLREQLKNPST